MAAPTRETKRYTRPWFENPGGPADFKKLLERKRKEEKSNPAGVINQVDSEGQTALHVACRAHRKDLVELLLAERADPNIKDNEAYTPLLAACSEDGNEDIIKVLLGAPGIDTLARNIDGSTALHYFAKVYNSPASEEVFRMMMQKGCPVNDVNTRGETPLHLSVLPGRLQARSATARLLLQSGADPNIITHQNMDSALHWAAETVDQELISLFLEKGADPTLKNHKGKTPAMLAEERGRSNIAGMLRQAEARFVKQKDFEKWLRSIGLEKFLPAFKKEEFDMESLPQIDEGVLENLKMPKGPQLTFMKAKKQLLEQKAPQPPPLVSKSGPGSLPTLPQTSAHLINFSDITMGPLLGKGFFAEVRQGEWRGTPIAVKIIYRESFRNKGDIELFYQEAEILSKLRFPNIVQFLGICVGDTHCIVTEYMKDGSLYSKLHDYPEDILGNPKWQLSIAIDIARGMNYLHGLTPPIMHRDLTSKNILLDGKIAKVADFGLSKEKDLSATMTASVGALPWVAPEVFTGEKFTEAADTFSYGVILWELWSGKDPQGDLAPLTFANKVAHEGYRPPLPPSVPGPIKDLIERCWSPNLKVRPGFDEILKILKSFEASGLGRKKISESTVEAGDRDDKHNKKEKKGKKMKSSTGTESGGGKSSSSKSSSSSSSSAQQSEASLLATYGTAANSDSQLLAAYGQPPRPAATSYPLLDSYLENPPSFSSGKSSSGDMYISNNFPSSSDDSGPAPRKDTADSIPSINTPPSPDPRGPLTNSSGAPPGQRAQLRQFHDRFSTGPVIFHTPAAAKNASPTHLRRVSIDEGRSSGSDPRKIDSDHRKDSSDHRKDSDHRKGKP